MVRHPETWALDLSGAGLSPSFFLLKKGASVLVVPAVGSGPLVRESFLSASPRCPIRYLLLAESID